MAAEPSRTSRQFDDVLSQLPSQQRATLDAARGQLSATQQQGQSISPELAGQLPVGSTPYQSPKDLIYKYGREAAPSAERSPSLEPDR